MNEQEIGLVIGIEERFVRVSLTRTEACAKCNACVSGFSKSEMILRAENKCGASMGDKVRINLDEGLFIKAASIIYLIPLAIMLAGAAAGMFFSRFVPYIDKEMLAFLTGMAMMLLAYYFISVREGKQKIKYMPKAVEIIK